MHKLSLLGMIVFIGPGAYYKGQLKRVTNDQSYGLIWTMSPFWVPRIARSRQMAIEV